MKDYTISHKRFIRCAHRAFNKVNFGAKLPTVNTLLDALKETLEAKFPNPWRKGFIERKLKRIRVSIGYEPDPFYGDGKKCEWKAGETISAFFKTYRPWKELNAEFCRKWGHAFIELVRGDVLRISGGTLTAQPTATPAWQNNKGRIEAYQDFTLVNVK